MSSPLVSVVIATWNAGKYLPETLSSALAQTWPNLEVIVVDDGSSDDTPGVVAPFLHRIRYERRSHRGLAASRNDGIRLASGEFVALLDADDLWDAEKIATQVEISRRNPQSGLVVSDGVEFAGEAVIRTRLFSGPFARALAAAPAGEITGDFQSEMIWANGICCPAQVLFPRRVLREIGPFADSEAQDYDYYLRVSQAYPITLHGHRHAWWRYRTDSLSGARSDRRIRWGLYALPVLLAHRRRCRPDHRARLDTRIGTLVSSLGYDLMCRGRTNGRRSVSSDLLNVLRVRPWSPDTVMHLAGLWSPSPVYRMGAKLARGIGWRR